MWFSRTADSGRSTKPRSIAKRRRSSIASTPASPSVWRDSKPCAPCSASWSARCIAPRCTSRAIASSAPRNGCQQCDRIGLLRRREHGCRRAIFHYLATLHDRNLIADLRRHPEIVGDEDNGETERTLEVRQQGEHLRLHGDIERGDRLIGHQDLGFEGQPAGERDPLALAAGKLVPEAAR